MLRAHLQKLGCCVVPVAQSESTVLFSQILVLLPRFSPVPTEQELWRERRREGEKKKKEEDDSFSSLSPGSQAFSLTGVVSMASSSVSTFLSFIFTRTTSISWPAEGICRGGEG